MFYGYIFNNHLTIFGYWSTFLLIHLHQGFSHFFYKKGFFFFFSFFNTIHFFHISLKKKCLFPLVLEVVNFSFLFTFDISETSQKVSQGSHNGVTAGLERLNEADHNPEIVQTVFRKSWGLNVFDLMKGAYRLVEIWTQAAFGPEAGLWTCLKYTIPPASAK